MSSLAQEATAVVEIERKFSAPLKTVWRAFTDAEAMSRWGVGHSYGNISMDIDLREGGVIHHRVRAKSTGDLWTFRGVYYTVESMRRLVYSFDWKTDWREDPTPSRVEIKFDDQGERTGVTVHHSQLFEPAAESTDVHWNEFLDLLEEMLVAKQIK